MGKGMTVVVLTVLFFFMWAFYISSNTHIPTAHIVGRSGRVFNIEMKRDSPFFQVDGFTFYAKSPMRSVKLKASKVWFISNKTGRNKKNNDSSKEVVKKGIISMTGLQTPLPPFQRPVSMSTSIAMKWRRPQPKVKVKPQDVTVLIKYHVHWDGAGAAPLSISGTDLELKEEVVEILPQQGESYCTRVVFLGPVHELRVEAVPRDPKSFVIIDELKVSVGTNTFESIDEVKCL